MIPYMNHRSALCLILALMGGCASNKQGTVYDLSDDAPPSMRGAATVAEAFHIAMDEQFALRCGPAVRRLVKVVLPEHVKEMGETGRFVVVEGEAIASLHFDRRGEPSQVDVQGSDERLVQEVRRAVSLWRVSPVPDGVECNMPIDLPFKFRRYR